MIIILVPLSFPVFVLPCLLKISLPQISELFVCKIVPYHFIHVF